MNAARIALLAIALSATARAQIDAAGADDGETGRLEDFTSEGTSLDPLPSFEASVAPPLEEAAGSGVTARAYGQLLLDLGVDTRFDGAPLGLEENVAQSLARARLGLDVRLTERLRALVEGRLRWRGATQEGWRRTKAYAEAELGEAFLDLYTPEVDLRLGQQIMAFGANVAFAPTDLLNPRDLREGLLLGAPEDAKLAVPAARALTQVGKVAFTAAWVPFFAPSRYVVFGQDEALVQPPLGVAVPTSRVDPSIEDALQPRLLETARPQAYPWLGDFGARASLKLGEDVRAGLSYVWVNEKLPQVTIDPELEALLASQARGAALDPALALSVENRLRAGEQLFRGEYGRQQVLGLELSALVRTTQVDVDLAYSPSQTLYDADLSFVRKPVYTLVVGVTQAEDSPLVFGVNYLALAVPDVRAEELLFLLEPGTARGGARTAFFHLLVGDVTYALLDDTLRLGLRAAFDPLQRSFALAPSVAWWPRSDLSVGLGAELFQGSAYSPFGYFGRNDQVVARLGLSL